MLARVLWLLLAAAVIFQAFVPPIVGLSDNADFGKVIGAFGMGAPWEMQRKFVAQKYTAEAKYEWADSPFRSSERVLAGIAVGVNRHLSRDGSMDIRVMGAVHAALFLAIWWVLLPELGWAGALGIVIFGDVLYISMLNTFHMDMAALLGLLAMIAFYARVSRTGRWSDGLGLLAGSLMLIQSKTQHAPLGLVLAALALVRRRYWFAAAWVGASAWMFTGMPEGYARDATYNIVFHRMLPASENPDADLAALGLDPSVKRYSGTYVYQPEGGRNDPKTEISHGRLALYYLRHPLVAWRHLGIAMNEGSRLRHAVGNFTRESGKPEYSESTAFAYWSGLKRAIFEEKGNRLTVFALVLAGLALATGVRSWRVAEWGPVLVALGAMILVELGIGALADTLEVARHLFLFHAMCDLVTVSLASAICNRFDTRP